MSFGPPVLQVTKSTKSHKIPNLVNWKSDFPSPMACAPRVSRRGWWWWLKRWLLPRRIVIVDLLFQSTAPLFELLTPNCRCCPLYGFEQLRWFGISLWRRELKSLPNSIMKNNPLYEKTRRRAKEATQERNETLSRPNNRRRARRQTREKENRRSMFPAIALSFLESQRKHIVA